MEVVCLILGPTSAYQPCSHAFWVLTSLHLLSFLLKMFFYYSCYMWDLISIPLYIQCIYYMWDLISNPLYIQCIYYMWDLISIPLYIQCIYYMWDLISNPLYIQCIYYMWDLISIPLYIQCIYYMWDLISIPLYIQCIYYMCRFPYTCIYSVYIICGTYIHVILKRDTFNFDEMLNFSCLPFRHFVQKVNEIWYPGRATKPTILMYMDY